MLDQIRSALGIGYGLNQVGMGQPLTPNKEPYHIKTDRKRLRELFELAENLAELIDHKKITLNEGCILREFVERMWTPYKEEESK